MSDMVLVEVGTFVMATVVVMAITAALAYVLVVAVESRKGGSK